MSSENEATLAATRIDVWLWAARFFKTRSLARQAVAANKVDVDGQHAKPARPVHVGDRLVITRGDERFEVEVLGLSATRGPARIAERMYAESEASRVQREAARAVRSAERAGYQAPQGKPDKRARKLIRALGDIDAL